MASSRFGEISSEMVRSSMHRLHRFVANPAGKPVARVILLHGYGDHAGKYLHLLTWLAEHGIAASATDFRGHGRSTGRVAHVAQWEEYLEDLGAMLAVVGEEGKRSTSNVQLSTPNSAEPVSELNIERWKLKVETLPPSVESSNVPTFLIAHSHGALIAIIAALRGMLDDCAGVIMSSPYLELKIPVHWTKRISAELASRILPSLRFKSGIGGAMLTHDPEFIEINETDQYCPGIATPRWFTTARKMQAEARASAALFKLPLLMLVAGDDVIADSRASMAFFEHAGSEDKQIHHYPTHRHELLREVGRDAIFKQMLDWMTERSNGNLPVRGPSPSS